MFKSRLWIPIVTSVLLCTTSNALENEDELGFNIGLLSIYNDNGATFDNMTIGATYQLNSYALKPRFDLDYVNINNFSGVDSLLKGSVNLVYEHDTQTNVIPYAIAGVGYEYVSGDKQDVFGSHGFVQGGVGLAYEEESGIKFHLEGKALQIIGGNDEENELIISAGVSFPLSFFAQDANQCPVKISGPDKDRDGVLDSVDQCPSTPCYFTVDNYGCPVKATLRLNFDVNKATVKHQYMHKVKNFASYLIRNKGTMVSIAGHTDSDGSANYNAALSKRRAEAVVSKLVELGVSRNRLSAHGAGESRPVASNATAHGRSLNRRIEAKLIYRNSKVRR